MNCDYITYSNPPDCDLPWADDFGILYQVLYYIQIILAFSNVLFSLALNFAANQSSFKRYRLRKALYFNLVNVIGLCIVATCNPLDDVCPERLNIFGWMLAACGWIPYITILANNYFSAVASKTHGDPNAVLTLRHETSVLGFFVSLQLIPVIVSFLSNYIESFASLLIVLALGILPLVILLFRSTAALRKVLAEHILRNEMNKQIEMYRKVDKLLKKLSATGIYGACVTINLTLAISFGILLLIIPVNWVLSSKFLFCTSMLLAFIVIMDSIVILCILKNHYIVLSQHKAEIKRKRALKHQMGSLKHFSSKEHPSSNAMTIMRSQHLEPDEDSLQDSVFLDSKKNCPDQLSNIDSNS